MSTNARYRTFHALAQLGIGITDARQLIRASATLHTWHEHECNGAIQRDEQTDIPYWHSTYDGKRIGRTADREKPAIKRVQDIAARYGLLAYVQTDPRGCALYLLRPSDIPAGATIDCCYNRGLAVQP